MAPSRALYRLQTIPRTLHRSSPRSIHLLPRQLSTSSSATLTTQHKRPQTQLPALKARPTRHFPAFSSSQRCYSTASAPEPPDHLNESELHIFNKIRGALQPVKLEVQDISGGCGSMYALEIESEKFKGLSVIKQHKMVNEVLKEEIAGWHGVQLRTKVPV